MTVTTAATAGANATVTLDGTAVTVALTNQATFPSRTAWEIAQGVYSAAGAAGTWGWDAYALGATVYFVARRARATSGSFSYAAGATGNVATGPTVVRAGVAESDDFGSPASPGNFTFFDALDETGPSGLTFNKQKSVIYGISAGHLGHRGARFFVMNPNTEMLFEFARYNYLNTSTFNLLQNPTLYLGWGIISNGSTTAMTMYAGSGKGGLEGTIDPDEGIPWAVRGAKVATNGVDVHFCSVQNGPVAGFGQAFRAARTKLRIDTIHISVLSASTSQYVDATIIRNPTITNLASFSQMDSTRLVAWAWQDTTTTTTTVSGGQTVDRPRVGQGSVSVVDLGIVLEPGEILSVNLLATGAGLICEVSMRGVELQ